MKKAIFALFQLQSRIPLIGRSALMVLFAWCCLGLQFSMAQVNVEPGEVIKIGFDSVATQYRLTECEGEPSTSSVRFTDDGENDGNYLDPDDSGRRDTVEICPSDQWHRVKVVFSEFDLEEDDTLFAFNGNLAALRAGNAPLAGTGTGTGISKFKAADPGAVSHFYNALVKVLAQAGVSVTDPIANIVAAVRAAKGDAVANALLAEYNAAPGTHLEKLEAAFRAVATQFAAAGGGWVQADCNPYFNPSGCLTFTFKTDDDNRKGRGWDAWVDCEARNVTFSDVDIPDVRLKCDDPPYARVRIPAPKITACDIELEWPADTVLTVVRDWHGEKCFEMKLKASGGTSTTPASITRTFAIGHYSVEYILLADQAKRDTVYFSIQEPALICNDDIEVPIGAACLIQLRPDDLLENPCDTIADIMYYNITVTLGTGKEEQTLETKNYDNHGAVIYPTITLDDIKAAGMSVCDATAKVTIERIYFGLGITPAAVDSGCDPIKKSAACETTLHFTDESSPSITFNLDADTLVACDTTGLAALLSTQAIDNCDDEVEVTYTVDFEEDDPCFAENGRPNITTATINFRAEDDCGNVGTNSKEVVILRPDLSDPQYVDRTEDISAECTDEASIPAPGVKIGVWKDNQFVPSGEVVQLNDTAYTCGYILVPRTDTIASTDCGRKYFRFWDVLDWCTPNQGPTILDTTYIEYTDKTPPEFLDTISDGRIAAIIIDLAGNACTSDVTKVGKPRVDDNCDDDPTVTLDAVFRVEDGTKWEIEDPLDWEKLPCDVYCLRWVVEDDCHEQLVNDTVLQNVEIRDVTDPVAICTDSIHVSLPNDQGIEIHWSAIDAGDATNPASNDACGIDSIRIRRKGTEDPWRETVHIECDDVHENPEVEVRVWDKKGNYNTCWATILVEDKISPICRELPDTTGICTDYHNDELGVSTDDGDGVMEDDEWQPLEGALLAVYNANFGNPVCEDNLQACGGIEIKQEYQLIQEDCGELRIRRRYWAIDWLPAGGNASTPVEQNIRIEYVPNWTLTFPPDVDLTCGETLPPEPNVSDIVSNGACDIFGLEITADTFEVPGAACLKIERTYEIINWCKHQVGQGHVTIVRNNEGTDGLEMEGRVFTNDNPVFRNGVQVGVAGEFGRFRYTQLIKLYVNDAPTVTINEVNTCIYGVGDVSPYGEEDRNLGAAPYECDTLRTFSATGTNCLNIPITNFTHKLYVDGVDVTANLGTDGIGASFSYVVEPKRTYKVEFWGSDACGNSSGEDATFTFWDCRKPTPFVKEGIAVEIGQDTLVQVWARDLELKSFDNCTPNHRLDFRIALGEPSPDIQTADDVRELGQNIDLTCRHLGTRTVSIYVIDEEGNWDVVATTVDVQDVLGFCTGFEPGDMMVAGFVRNPNGENIESVGIAINGGAQRSMTTASDGHFQFMLPNGGNYSVTPTKDINPLNGVSTFDLVLISKHILGISEFDTPYKYIAADVNKSGTITAFDMVQVRQLILGITNDFPNNDSWRFVDAAYSFTSANPASEAFGEFVNIDNLTTDMPNVNFIGVKVGDINGSALVNSLLGAEVRSTNGTLTFNAADQFVEAGQTVTVEFTAADIESTQGYQFTMNFVGLEFAELVEGVAKAANFNTNMSQRGLLTTSWNGETTADAALFALTFKATATGLLSDFISVSSDFTTAEAYNTAGDLLDININFTSADMASIFELKQNTPNPFNGETVIGFNLPETGAATLKVMDVQGKVLKAITNDYARGYHQIILNAKELGSTGVLYYQLESKDKVATRKMVIIE